MVKVYIGIVFCLTLLLACNHTKRKSVDSNKELVDSVIIDTLSNTRAELLKNNQPLPNYSDTSFVNIKALLPDVELNFVYADTANFFKEALYPCEECLLRYEVAVALKEVSKYLNSKGYQLLLFDCYRPFNIQQRMWKILPDRKSVV